MPAASSTSLQGHMTKRKRASRECGAHVCCVCSLEEDKLKYLLQKDCLYGEKTCGRHVLVEETSCPLVFHSSHYLRCPTALVRTSERMM